MTIPAANLTNHFLIAMPQMADPHFARSLTYIAEHNAQGALGIVVNRPTELSVGTLFERIDLPPPLPGLARQPVHFGGPVQTDRGFVLHRPAGHWHATLKVTEAIALTSSRDILEAAGRSGEPADLLVALGYAGWTAGQLESELAQNAWLSVPADLSIVFGLPAEERLAAAMQLLGVNFASLSEVAGHA